MVNKKDKKPKVNKTPEEMAEHKRERSLADIRFVAKSPEGRRFIWSILADHDVFRENDILEQIESNRFEGRRNAGIRLLTKLQSAKPSLLGQMQEEHASAIKSEELEIELSEEQSDPLSL